MRENGPCLGRHGGRETTARRAGAPAGGALALLLGALSGGCVTASLDEAGALSSYGGLGRSDGMLTQSRIAIDKPAILGASTERLIPISFVGKAAATPLTPEQRQLIANAVDRSLCVGLSERLTVRRSGPADLTVQAFVSQIVPTNEYAAAASKAASIAKSVLLPDIPGPTLRLPIGLGSLSVEAEARGAAGEQRAAMIWGRGANALFGTTRVSAAGDAYEFASAFGDDFSTLIVTGESPFGKMPALPSGQRLQAMAGGAPKQAVCEAFGRAPGVTGLIGGIVGAPPEWTDRGAAGLGTPADVAGPDRLPAYKVSPASQ
jgi:hypothetical protein